LEEYKTHPKFIEYIAQEQIVLDISTLNNVDPEHVGYLEEVVGRHDTLEAHTKRLKELLPDDIPHFQLNIHTLKTPKGGRCKVFMINCDSIHLDQIRHELLELHAQGNIVFMSWREFSGTTDEIRNVAIRKQLLYIRSYHSLIIPGFIDNEDNVFMKGFDPDELDTSNHDNDKIKYTFVSDYIASIPAGNGEPLFIYVYPPFNGKREVIIKWYNRSEAKELIKVIHGELAKHMNDISIQMVFEDPEGAKDAAKTSTWVSYSRAAQLLQESKDNHFLKNPNKRIKTNSRKSTSKNGKTNTRKQRSNNKVESTTNTLPTAAPTSAPAPSPAAWVVPPTIIQQKEPTVSTTTETAAIELEDFKQSLRNKIFYNTKRVQDQLKNEIAQVKTTTDKAIQELDQTMDGHVTTINNSLEEHYANTNISLDILEHKVDGHTDNLTNRIYNLEQKTDINRNRLEEQYDDIKTVLLELKLSSSNKGKRKNDNASVDISENHDESGVDMSLLDVSRIEKTSANGGLQDTQYE
jgi:hypothetical protein